MEFSSIKYKWVDSLDNTFFKMKEAQLIQMKNKIDALTRIVKHVLQEVNNNATLVKGLLTSFQLHIGEEEWKKLVEELKEVEERETKQTEEKKLDLDGVE